MRTTTRAHYVKHNAVTRVPRAFVYLDTEARRQRGPRHELQTFRLGVMACDRRTQHRDGWREREWATATTTQEIWAWVAGQCRPKARTVLVAHNLSYDLRISDAFTHLPEMGFEFVAGRVDDGQTWMIWKNGDRSLWCVDSLSWVPKNLGALGTLVGIDKLDLPDDDDTDDAWLARCTRDVEILAEVWRRIVAWIVDDDLGNFKLSGAGQSWAAFRHRFMRYPLLVHECDPAREAERAAAHTGRCEAWQHGKLRAGPFAEWDFTTAYAVIGRDCEVPTKLCGEMHRPTLAKVLQAARKSAALIECEITTDVPTVPLRTDIGICWPIGTFRTTIWENELAAALESGARVEVARCWLYRSTPALRDFCAWVLDGLDGSRGNVDPIVRVALKHWSRALIGRTAARWSKWESWGESPTSSVGLSRLHDASTGELGQLLQLGTQLIRQSGERENPDAMVAVMSWVMAESRVRLWAAMNHAGLANVVYVDTDSLIVNQAGSDRLAAVALPGLRIKGEWSEIEVLGPRQIIPGASLRAAGVPKGARRVDEAHWEAEVWSGLSRGLASGNVASVEVARRVFHLRGTDNRREHLPGGLTRPFEASAGLAVEADTA